MNKRNFAVGIFVAVALAAFVFASIWLTGKQGSEPTAHYSMFFEKDVSGLMVGGPVFYLGVEVGTLTSMEIIPGNPTRVRVDARILQSTPIDGGTYASIALQGITGVAVIRLKAEPGVHGPLGKDENAPYPVIAVRDSGFSALLARTPDIIDELDSVLARINALLGDENRDSVRRVLGDIATVSQALAAKQDDIEALPALLRQTLEELNGTLAQFRTLATKLEPDLLSVTRNLEAASANVASLSGRLETWASANEQQIDEFLGEGVGQVPALLDESRATLREIQKLVNDLRRDPTKLVYRRDEQAIEREQ